MQINLSDGFYQNILFKSITHYFNKFKNILKLDHLPLSDTLLKILFPQSLMYQNFCF